MATVDLQTTIVCLVTAAVFILAVIYLPLLLSPAQTRKIGLSDDEVRRLYPLTARRMGRDKRRKVAMMHDLIERHVHVQLYGPFAFVVSSCQAVYGFVSSSPIDHVFGFIGATSSFIIACATIMNARTNRMNAETNRINADRAAEKKTIIIDKISPP